MQKIRVFDFETTGFEPPEAEVVELGWCDLTLDEFGWSVGAWSSRLYGVRAMPPQARAVHHIGHAEVAGFPSFAAGPFWLDCEMQDVAAVASHNFEFDGQFLGEPLLPAICTYKSALRLWPEAPAHNNGTLRYWLQDAGHIAPTHEMTLPSHRAGPDAYVTAHILMHMLERGERPADLIAWTKEPRLLPTCPIGKFRGKPWREVETGFLSWMLNQPTMEADLKWNAQRELDRRVNGG